MAEYTIDAQAMLAFLVGLLNTPSPTGYHERAIAYCKEAFSTLPLVLSHTRKGALVGVAEGAADNAPRGLTAHVDTLGAIVSQIRGNGRLKMSQLGGWAWGSVEGEGVTIYNRAGDAIRGAILPTKASVHIFGSEARDFKREADNYEIRLDVRSESAKDTRTLGVEVGDWVVFDPRVEVSEAGFVRSRHLDDKAGVACIYAALKALADAGLTLAQRTIVHLSNYEEVGHGAASGFPPDMAELLSVDMAAAGGETQNSDEFSVGICVKDAGGPYHIEMKRRLVGLAEQAGIPYKLDIYPYYGSDGEAFWRAGGDVIVGLIGPGVDASHHYERTHVDSLTATAQLIAEYLLAS
jgi:putative aminopeptidase FrvX